MPKANALTVLKKDHQQLKSLLAELSDTTERSAKRRLELIEQIATLIKAHTTMEEEIFYPAYHESASKRDDEKLYYEAMEEHHAADVVLADLMKADASSLNFAGKAKVLRELIEQHTTEEEKQMFPKAKHLLGEEALSDIGHRLEERKMQLMEGASGKQKQNGQRASTARGASNGRRTRSTKRASASASRRSSSRAASAHR